MTNSPNLSASSNPFLSLPFKPWNFEDMWRFPLTWSLCNQIAVTLHPHLNCRRFDRTIFSLPHSGFLGKDNDSGLTEKHIDLVFGFINGTRHMVRGDRGIHVSHKDCYKPSVTRKIKFLQCI
ncbi:unnamed protein product [Brassica rapa subsp. trilocularis]